MKRFIGWTVTITFVLMLVSVGVTGAQTFQETVNYIFNSNKEWASVQYSGGYYKSYNQLSDYEEANCTVRIDSQPSTINGTIFLNNVRRWTWRSFEGGGLLTLEGEGTLFEGFYTPNGARPLMGITSKRNCSQSCQFYTPGEIEMWRLDAAFKHLGQNYCKSTGSGSAF